MADSSLRQEAQEVVDIQHVWQRASQIRGAEKFQLGKPGPSEDYDIEINEDRGSKAHTPDCKRRTAMKFPFGRNSLSTESQVMDTPKLVIPGLAGQRAHRSR